MNSQKVFNFPTMTIALLATKSHSNFGHFCSQATAYISAPGDAELMEKMKQAIDNQRDSIRSKNADIDSLRKDLEAVRASQRIICHFPPSVATPLAQLLSKVTRKRLYVPVVRNGHPGL